MTSLQVTGTAVPTGRRRRVLRWSPWVALVVAVAIALAVGSHRPSHPSLEQRTMSIASAVRCPVCVGETAAESNVPASVEIRVVIRQDLQAGETRAQILSHLSAVYGPGILEKPPVRGVNLLLWVLPAVAVTGALAGLVLAFLRWRPARATEVSDDDRRLIDRLLGAGPALDGGPSSPPHGGDGAVSAPGGAPSASAPGGASSVTSSPASAESRAVG